MELNTKVYACSLNRDLLGNYLFCEDKNNFIQINIVKNKYYKGYYANVDYYSLVYKQFYKVSLACYIINLNFLMDNIRNHSSEEYKGNYNVKIPYDRWKTISYNIMKWPLEKDRILDSFVKRFNGTKKNHRDIYFKDEPDVNKIKEYIESLNVTINLLST